MKRCPKCGNQFPDDANFCPGDAGRLEEVQADAGATTPDFKATQPFGGRFSLGARAGGTITGELYMATDKQTGTMCLVKLVDPGVFPTPLLLQRTERELNQLERIDYPGVIRVLDHGKRDGQLWIATERFEGRPIADVIAESGPMESERAARVVHSIGQALAEAAKLGVIHRDLAPKNILLGPADQVKVINFGVAVPATDKVQGVPEYVAPEQVEGKPVDQRSNIYSLGALFYFLLTGRPPYSGDSAEVHAQHVNASPPPPSELASVLPTVDALVLKALEKSSSKRFMTLRQLLGELENVIEGKDPATTQKLGGVELPVEPPRGKSVMPSEVGSTLLGVPAMAPRAADRAKAETAPMTVDAAIGAPPSAPSTKMPAAQPVLADVSGAGPAATQLRVSPAAAALPSPASTVGSIPSGKSRSVTNDDTEPVPVMKTVRAAAAVAAPVASGKNKEKKKKRESSKNKGKFRETMWFKKGELDEAAAEAAAAKSGDLVSDRADEMPIEDRYADDGTLSAHDQERLSLRTGATQMMGAATHAKAGKKRLSTDVSEEELASELSAGRTKIIVAIAAVVIVLIVIVVMFAR